MPWTLYRYILKDLIKVLSLATAVLMVVIAVAAAIKPLSDGLLGPAGLVKFVIYLLPTMLGFALPFAAAFAGTMVFCRLAADNEILACRAGGMSYRAILLPVFLLGFVLTLELFYLSNWVVPTFYLMADRQLEQDMSKTVVNQIKKRQPVTLSNTILYADAVDDSQPPPVVYDASGQPAAIQPYQLIMLQGVAVGRMGDRGQVRSDATAQRADVLLYRVGGQTWMTMQLLNFMYSSIDGRHLLFARKSDSLQIRIPNPFQDRLHFLSWPEMEALGEHPERFDEVANRKQQLVDAIATERLISMMANALEPSHGGAFKLKIPEGWLVIGAPRAQKFGNAVRLYAVDGVPVRIEYLSSGLPSRRLEAAEADVVIDAGDSDSSPHEPEIVIGMRNLKIFDPQLKGYDTGRQSLTLERASWPQPVEPDLLSQSATGLLEAASNPASTPAVTIAARQLADSIAHLARKIMGRLHGRASSSVACLPALLLGAVLSLVLRGSMPLTVYFWAFILATLAVVIARSGENIASESSAHLTAGLVVIWSGNLLLAGVVTGLFLRLRRN